MAPYSSAQNGLAEQAIRTTIDDICTLLHDSGLSHSYWAEAASYSVFSRNLIPSCHHPGTIPLQAFTGHCQSVSHLRVFGAKCWAKVPTVNGTQVTGGSKLDPRGIECCFLCLSLITTLVHVFWSFFVTFTYPVTSVFKIGVQNLFEASHFLANLNGFGLNKFRKTVVRKLNTTKSQNPWITHAISYRLCRQSHLKVIQK